MCISADDGHDEVVRGYTACRRNGIPNQRGSDIWRGLHTCAFVRSISRPGLERGINPISIQYRWGKCVQAPHPSELHCIANPSHTRYLPRPRSCLPTEERELRTLPQTRDLRPIHSPLPFPVPQQTSAPLCAALADRPTAKASVGGLSHSRIVTRRTRSPLCTRMVLGLHTDSDHRTGKLIPTIGHIPASRFVAPSHTGELEFIPNCIILDITKFFESHNTCSSPETH